MTLCLTNGYNGHLTSWETGSVGGQVVKNVCPDTNAITELLWAMYSKFST